MSTIAELYDVGSCSKAGFLGTETGAYCPFDISRIKAIWRFDYNFNFESNFEFTKANLQTLVQSGKMKVIKNLKNATWTTPEDAIQTYDDGVKKMSNKNPYEFTVKVDTGGIQQYRSIATIEDVDIHSIVLVDDEDNIFICKRKSGAFGGTNAPFLNLGPYMGPSGTDAAGATMTVQMDKMAIKQLHVIKPDNLDFSPDEISDWYDVVANITAPADGATTFTFTLARLADQGVIDAAGFDESVLKLKVNDVVTSMTVAESNDIYTATVSALSAGDELVIYSEDATGYKIVGVDEFYYKVPESDVATVTA